MNQDFVQVR